MGEWWAKSYGIPRMTGRVLGWLLVCDPAEQTAAQLAEELGASKGSISGATGMLVRAGLVDRLHVRGERADRFRIRPEAWDEQIRDQGASQARSLVAMGLEAWTENRPRAGPGSRSSTCSTPGGCRACRRSPRNGRNTSAGRCVVGGMADGGVAVEVRGLVKRFGEVRALDGLDLRVQAGTVFGLLGPNGAGKTTLVRIVATLLAPTAGCASVLGHDVVSEPLAVRRRIGLAGQFAAVDGELTGRENLEMVARLYRLPRPEARRRAGEVLERFDLLDAAERRAATYSGGMRRRLDLAAGLIGRPPVL